MELNFIESSPGPVKAGLAMLTDGETIGCRWCRSRKKVARSCASPCLNSVYSYLSGLPARGPRYEGSKPCHYVNRSTLLLGEPENQFTRDDRTLLTSSKTALNTGEIRAAQRSEEGVWCVNSWSNKNPARISHGPTVDMSVSPAWRFFDKIPTPHAPPLSTTTFAGPGWSSIRDGAYIASGVVCMPPMYVNVGAYLDGKERNDRQPRAGGIVRADRQARSPLARRQIGGVLEPVGAMP